MGGGGGAAVITLLVPPGAAPGRREPVDEAEGHHLRVRRVAAGERVALRDGLGLVGTGRLASDGREWAVEVEAVERRARPAELTLAIGAGDRDRFAWVVEKAVELGATTVVPLETERTISVFARIGSHSGMVFAARCQSFSKAVSMCAANSPRIQSSWMQWAPNAP